ncbi:iris-like [Haemaphysalis longicornis]
MSPPPPSWSSSSSHVHAHRAHAMPMGEFFVRSPGRRPSQRKNDAELSHAILELAIDLYRAARSGRQNGEKNVLLSPYLIASVLQFLYSVSRGESAEQVARRFRWPPQPDHKGASRAAEYFAHRDYRLMPECPDDAQRGFTTYYSCCLHVDRRVILRPDFEASFRRSFSRFSRGSIIAIPAPRRRRVNWRRHDFVNDAVHQRWKIEAELVETVPLLKSCDFYKCLPSGCVGEHTKLVLLCALGVKGRWRRRFDPAEVSEGVFYEIPEGDGGCTKDQFFPRPVIMMHQTGSYRMADCADLEATALELPYKNKRRSLIILLPLKLNGLDALESRMTADAIAECILRLQKREGVDVSLPKFRVHAVIDLAAVLPSAGINALFQEGVADLSGVCVSEGVSVSAARHAAAFRTSWKGRVSRKQSPPQPSTEHQKFTVNRPFLYIVRCEHPDAVLLMGSVRKVKPFFKPERLPKPPRATVP